MAGTTGPGPNTTRPARHLAVAPAHPRQVRAEPAGQVVIRLRDAGLVHVIEDVHLCLSGLLETGPHTVVVDMSEVSRLSSTTIAALLWIRRCCTVPGVDVKLRATSRHNVETLERMGLLGALALETESTRSTRR